MAAAAINPTTNPEDDGDKAVKQSEASVYVEDIAEGGKTLHPSKLSRHGLPLDPQPSDDPFDPLNWSRKQKLALLAVLCIWEFMGTCHLIAVAPAFFAISKELGCSLTAATYLVGAPLLAYGVASLIWVAVGNRFGVRLVFVCTSLAGGLLCIWGAKATSFASLVAARTLSTGLMASPETLGPQAIADVFFLGDRAKCMALLILFEAGGFTVGSVIGAAITAQLGWRWIEWTLAILTLSTCVLLFFFFPETQFTRTSAQVHHRKRRLRDNLAFTCVSGGGQKKVNSFWRAFLYPFRYVPHPAVIIMTLHFSVMLMATSYMLTSNTFIYQEGYAFDVYQTGLTGIAPFIGNVLAVPYCGLLNDWYMTRLRQKGTFQPELRLPFFLVTAVLAPVGCIIVGVCAQREFHWVTPLIGEALLSFAFLVAASLTQTYLIDVYHARADATLVIENGFKNFAAFAISYAIVPWNTADGYEIPFGVLAALTFAAHVPVLVLWWKGLEIRQWSAKVWKSAQPSYHGDTF